MDSAPGVFSPIPLLTGKPAGTVRDSGRFNPSTVAADTATGARFCARQASNPAGTSGTPGVISESFTGVGVAADTVLNPAKDTGFKSWVSNH